MESIFTDNAPKAIGPYSQAVQAGPFMFVSGQVPINPKTGKVESEEITAQTKQVMANLQAILAKAGTGFDKVAKTTIFLKDLNDFVAVNEIYGAFFKEPYPARATVEVSKLPLDVKVEIEMVVYLK